MSAAELWARLGAEGLVEGEMPAPDRSTSPWYVRVMLGIAGWIGALFLLVFAGAAFSFLMSDPASALLAGAACCGGAFALLRGLDGNDFAEQFGLAVSLAGQGLMIMGLADLLDAWMPLLYIAIAAMQAVLALLVPNFLHRLLATCGAAIAGALAVNAAALHGLSAPILCLGLALVWLEPKLWAVRGGIWRPVGYGLVLALLLVETFRLFGDGGLFASAQAPRWIAIHGPLIGRVLTAAILLFVAAVLIAREGAGPRSPVARGAGAIALVLALVSLAAPGLASALLILLLGFAVGDRLFAGLGILSLLGFVSHFYYSLHATLLEKSAILAATGLCLLLVRFALRRGFAVSGTMESGHA
ncbi:DUF4401 domain-containing protein [Sphingomonas colocasiae]|uniref:DUF4401 domain-containing protein n=1 Tax=Sphingomonas colocasiae TaxID=1848973 RepID=A0ABS7PVA4_9SPHN|nr:DUF4401 domain-containing protein [Sphingomonas colocasiae]MBY8825290.1 DUF4401 domain-containing protein [Sphingomonas colocasiae]